MFLLNDACLPEVAFKTKSLEIRSIEELYYALRMMSDEEFKEYVKDNNNAFATWIRDIFHEEELANKLEAVNNRDLSIIVLKEFINKKLRETNKDCMLRPFLCTLKEYSLGVFVGLIIGLLLGYMFFFLK